MAANRIAVGHAGDEVADRADHGHGLGRFRPPWGRQQGGIGAIGGEQAGDHRLCLGAYRLDLRRIVHMDVEEGLQRPLLGRHRLGKAGERAAGAAYLVSRLHARFGDPAHGLGKDVGHHQPDQLADQLGCQPRFLDVGIARPDAAPDAGGERHVDAARRA